ncbi:DUF1146 family protein [Alkalicoccobacillus porphyridii]|uniref:DUF1146 domain-containing protein n=1 Tax=Alkalicoccobacillus porphyridii TaxID=2597270 RepID=A0A553ZTD9_9BACI|nr:DUF1146 family protein [Alkalicoccobacillus porphyridii]TSB44741.1 DUF1146 domain-containing protein [Alkalicoccobacillus porphyridii]
MTDGFGQDALIQILVNLFSLGLCWWALASFRFDLFVREPKGPQAIMLRLLTALALAYLVSRFFLEYLQASRLLQYLW